jgi:hypothetical protein
LVDWCKIKLECPTCKQPFQTFRHSIQIQPPLEQIYTPDHPTTDIPDSDTGSSDEDSFLSSLNEESGFSDA